MKSITDVLLLALDVVMVVAGQFLIKFGVRSVGQFGSMGTAQFLKGCATNAYIISGVGLYAISAVVWLALLSRVELSVAYPALSAGYILVVLVAWAFLGEPMTVWKLLGVLLIAGGVWLVNR